MNNSFKFRVWDHILSEWIKSDQLVLRPNGSVTDGSILIDSKYIQRYTGLTDKNDNPIYEGDIIHLKFGELNANLVVKWDKYMGLKYHNGGWTSLVHVETHGEVIGNIFENPELPN